MTAPPIDRAGVPVTKRWHYLNHAGVAPLPTPAVEAVEAYLRRVRDDGALAYRANEDVEQATRVAGARMMGVDVDDVAFVKNTTEGLNFVAAGFDWRPGDRVVVPACEFPSNLYPWMALEDRGVSVVRIEPVGSGDRLPLEAFEEALRAGGVRIVAASWVQFGRGWRIDLEELAALCHRHDALLVVDAIQGLGVIPADFAAWQVDAACADGHKWLLGPEGLGFLYVTPAMRERLRVSEPGWNAVAHRTEWENRDLVLDATARRFEGGTANYAGASGLGASLELLLDSGIARIWQHVDGLCAALEDGLRGAGARVLSERSETGKSAIVTFSVEGVPPEALSRALRSEGVVVSPRGGGVRAAPHGYNDLADIERLVELVAAH